MVERITKHKMVELFLKQPSLSPVYRRANISLIWAYIELGLLSHHKTTTFAKVLTVLLKSI